MVADDVGITPFCYRRSSQLLQSAKKLLIPALHLLQHTCKGSDNSTRIRQVPQLDSVVVTASGEHLVSRTGGYGANCLHITSHQQSTAQHDAVKYGIA